MSKAKQSTVIPSVMAQITHNNVKMLPKAYFSVIAVIGLVGSACAGLVISYLFSILVYWLRIQTADTMARGARDNLSNTIDGFPWWALPVIVAAFTSTVWLVRRQHRMYRYKPVATAIAVLGVTLIMGIVMSYTGIGTRHTNSPFLNNHDQRSGQGRYYKDGQGH